MAYHNGKFCMVTAGIDVPSSSSMEGQRYVCAGAATVVISALLSASCELRGDKDHSTTQDAAIDALVDAIDAGNTSVALQLLEDGIDPNAVTNRPTPLMAAIRHLDGGRFVCSPLLVEGLLKHGADPNRIEPPLDELPLFTAISIGAIDCAKVLVAHGARADVVEPSGDTLMDAAVVGVMNTGDKAVLQLPVAWGVDPAARGGPQGTTALWQAVFFRSELALQGLLELPVDPCIRDNGGHIALDMARVIKWDVGIRILGSASSCPDQTRNP